MPVTNLQISMNEYQRLIAEDREKAKKREVYGKLLKDLSELVEMMPDYFVVNEAGKARSLKDDDYIKLITGYSKLKESCVQFLSEKHDRNRMENQRINMITRLSVYVEKDLKGLQEANRNKNLTLSDVVKGARTRIVDLTGQSLDSIGGGLSSRIPLKTPGGTEGFFAKKYVYNVNAPFYEIMKRIQEVLPKEFLSVYNSGGEQSFLGELSSCGEVNIHSKNDKVKEKSYKRLAEILRTVSPKKKIDDLVDFA